MTEKRKLAAILAADVVGFSRLTGSDEEGTLARLRTLWSDLIAPTISVHNGRVVKRTGDGSIIEFRSVVDAVRCAIEVQNGMVERNAGLPPERRIEFRVGIHLGDVVEESDGDLMGDGVNIAARLEGIADPGGICLSEDAYRQVRDRLKEGFIDLGEKELKNIARPVRAYAIKTGSAGPASATLRTGTEQGGSTAPLHRRPALRQYRRRPGAGVFRRWCDGEPDHRSLAHLRLIRDRAQHRLHLQGKTCRSEADRARVERALRVGGQRPALRQPLRVNVQLIDAESGAHLWAERFESLWPIYSTCRTKLSRASPIS